MKCAALVVAAVASLASVSVHASTKEMPAGLWQITNKMDIPGLPPEAAAKMGNMGFTYCVKPGEKRSWSEQRNPMERGERKCEPTDMKTDGNTVSWKLKCADGTSGEGSVSHNGKDAYTMNMTISSQRGTMKIQSEGKKIADTCEKGPGGK